MGFRCGRFVRVHKVYGCCCLGIRLFLPNCDEAATLFLVLAVQGTRGVSGC